MKQKSWSWLEIIERRLLASLPVTTSEQFPLLSPIGPDLILTVGDSYYHTVDRGMLDTHKAYSKTENARRLRSLLGGNPDAVLLEGENRVRYQVRLRFSEERGAGDFATTHRVVVLPNYEPDKSLFRFFPEKVLRAGCDSHPILAVIASVVRDYTDVDCTLRDHIAPWLARCIALIRFAKASGALVVIPPAAFWKRQPSIGDHPRFYIETPEVAESRLNNLTMAVLAGELGLKPVHEGGFGPIVELSQIRIRSHERPDKGGRSTGKGP